MTNRHGFIVTGPGRIAAHRRATGRAQDVTPTRYATTPGHERPGYRIPEPLRGCAISPGDGLCRWADGPFTVWRQTALHDHPCSIRVHPVHRPFPSRPSARATMNGAARAYSPPDSGSGAPPVLKSVQLSDWLFPQCLSNSFDSALSCPTVRCRMRSPCPAAPRCACPVENTTPHTRRHGWE